MSDSNKQHPITAVQDLIAGGIAGSVSVVVGHPFDTYKVRLQTSTGTASSFGGISSLYRGIVPPLSTAAVVNAAIFSSYGESTRIWDYFHNVSDESKSDDNTQNQSSWKKAFVCGSFAGSVQALIICPSEHVKCRLQIQSNVAGCKDPNLFKGPFDVADKILNSYGVSGLYRGFVCTAWREVPAFGLYFATYDVVKETITNLISPEKVVIADHQRCELVESLAPAYDNCSESLSSIDEKSPHEWAASALAGGCSGALTWAAVYPFDVIKTRIQTAPLSTPLEERRMMHMFHKIKNEYGMKFFFRGLGVTVFRAFPVNAIIFPVYEYTLFELNRRGIGSWNNNEYLETAV